MQGGGDEKRAQTNSNLGQKIADLTQVSFDLAGECPGFFGEFSSLRIGPFHAVSYHAIRALSSTDQ